jgi:ribonuclease HII
MTHSFDEKFWKEGIVFLAGIDEVGRGPLAGPVVAAAVILNPKVKINKLDDSKKLTEKTRLVLEPRIKEKALDWAVAEASVAEIDTLNIVQATFLAMRRAVDQLLLKPDFLLVDGRDFPTFLYQEEGAVLAGQAVIKGDGISTSIAAASILAKVYRDDLMGKLAKDFPVYGFEKHKGYGAKQHLEAILKQGPCVHHRKKFIRNIMQKKAEQMSLV